MEWHIEPTNKMESDAIRIVSFEDSKYDASQSVEKLEKSGKRGDTILIEGMKTGSAKICVRFEDPLLKVRLFLFFLFEWVWKKTAKNDCAGSETPTKKSAFTHPLLGGW